MCRCRRKCLGHVDPVTGDIVPNRGHGGGDAAEVLNIGATRLFDHIAESIGLKSAVSIAMPEKADKLAAAMHECMESERRVVVTGHRDGATCREFGDYLLEKL